MDYLAGLHLQKGDPDSAIIIARQALALDRRGYHINYHYYWLGKAYITLHARDSALKYAGLEMTLGDQRGNHHNHHRGRYPGEEASPAGPPRDRSRRHGEIDGQPLEGIDGRGFEGGLKALLMLLRIQLPDGKRVVEHRDRPVAIDIGCPASDGAAPWWRFTHRLNIGAPDQGLKCESWIALER